MSENIKGICKVLRLVFYWYYVRIRGCYFHFAQCIYRKVVELKYANDYALNSDGFQDAVRMLIALGLVPADQKIFYVSFIWEKYRHNPKVMHFMNDYFVKYWIHKVDHTLWDWFNVTIRANNHVEGWHRALNAEFSASHVNCFISFLL